jgi:hypothetical protein
MNYYIGHPCIILIRSSSTRVSQIKGYGVCKQSLSDCHDQATRVAHIYDVICDICERCMFVV